MELLDKLKAIRLLKSLTEEFFKERNSVYIKSYATLWCVSELHFSQEEKLMLEELLISHDILVEALKTLKNGIEI